jgi:hypothetical protein
MPYITQQEFCDMLRISKMRLRQLLREHEFPVYEVKRCGRLVYDEKEAIAFVKIMDVERTAARNNAKVKRWLNSRGKK